MAQKYSASSQTLRALDIDMPTHPRCFFDDLLMSPLDAAVSLKQVDGVAVHISKHLNLHVSAATTNLPFSNRVEMVAD